jgi:hypothetical protein
MKVLIVIGCIILAALALGAFALTLTGLWCAFSASILLGVIFLVLEPAPLVLGICVLGGNNWAPQLVEFLHLPF